LNASHIFMQFHQGLTTNCVCSSDLSVDGLVSRGNGDRTSRW
jgi:hypothetical protein